MAGPLVLVESPAKAKTIEKFLGHGAKVLATYGHVRALPRKNGSVQPEQDFAVRYEVLKDSQQQLDRIAKELKGREQLILATDPDREGEAIAWHVAQWLEEQGLLEGRDVKRVSFNEITKKAVQEAMAAPRDVAGDLVDAQQARSALDYLVGFTLSPLLWKKVTRGLSAGRVQSVALRLICDREAEIEAFKPREYWTIDAQLKAGKGKPFPGKLSQLGGEKLDKFSIGNEQAAGHAVAEVRSTPLTVLTVEKKEKKRNPAPPFTTSTLQQEASRKLGMSAKQTMRAAQELYEGVDLGGETVGLITYMRTDSTTLSQEALEGIRTLIGERFGAPYLPKNPKVYKTKAKNAQEAHEAIRPSDVARTPDDLKGVLGRNQLRLYTLIWQRAVACQMNAAVFDVVGVDIGHDRAVLRATGSTLRFDGFLKLYEEGRDTPSEDEEDEQRRLPALEVGQAIELTELTPNQHFTEPPPRFTEATLVKTLESFGIGRPSTYASIMSTIQERGYVKLEKRQFQPSQIGKVVSDFLVAHFPRYVETTFTADVEDDLDAISRGERPWKQVLKEFWSPFAEAVKATDKGVTKAEGLTEESDKSCPQCGKPLVIRVGRYGRFYACTGYPECKFKETIREEGEEPAGPEILEGTECPTCGKPLAMRKGRYGLFKACSDYPTCKTVVRDPKPEPRDTGIVCDACGEGHFVEKQSRRGKTFFSCNRYPKCKNALWNEPIPVPCPKCKAPYLTAKRLKRGDEAVCAKEECDFKAPLVEVYPQGVTPKTEASQS